MKISIGSDHRGFLFKSEIIKHFVRLDWLDVGTNSTERTDYPIYAKKVCQNILDKKADLGILICGSGVGMSIAANRFVHIYAALCWNKEVAQKAREDDCGNILVLPADFISLEQALEIVQTWLNSEFKDGIYADRLKIIDAK